MSGAHLSKDFFELIKAIGECKSKQEEDAILERETQTLKNQFQLTNLSPKKHKEAIVRMMYAEMLGHDSSFGHIHAVNMTQQTHLLAKRVGYLACALCLHSTHELVTLLVNTMRRDLKSTNHIEVCAALIAIPKLINTDVLPALLEPTVVLLEHSHEVVRKKAVMVLHRYHQLAPGSMATRGEQLRRVLCDRDPAVMGASLYLLHDIAEADPSSQKDLVPSYVSILKQVTEHRLPTSFDYHRVPAPWIQIKLLKLLATLGTADEAASAQMYEVLYEVLRRADTGINIGYAIIYECVRTITAIFPSIALLETAATHISRFVGSENHNLKYLGIKALAAIVQVDQKYALDHQLLVIDCMEDPDETLKRKTLELLFRMTNASNVVFVVDKLLAQLRATGDAEFRASLTERITQLAERYAPDNSWFIRTMNVVFELGGDLVRADVAHNLMRLIAEGSGEDEEADTALRAYAASTYYELLAKPNLPDVLTQVVCWVLGEYAYLAQGVELVDVLERLCDAADRQFSRADTRGWVVVAITKLVAQLGELPEQAAEVAARYADSRDVLLSRYCYELQALADAGKVAMAEALPVDASCEDLEVDPNLSFLDGFVAQALSRGAQPYLPQGQRPDELDPSGPRELTEKEKMAAALFGGIGTAGAAESTVPAPPKEKKKKAKKPTEPTAAPPAATVGGLVGDLLDLDMGGAPAPPPMAIEQASPTAAPTPATSPPPANDLLSLLDAPAMPVASLGVMASAVAPVMTVGAAAPTDATSITGDARIDVALSTTVQPATTLLVIVLRARGATTLSNVVLQLEPPPGFVLSVEAPVGAEARGNRVTLPTVLAGAATTVTAYVKSAAASGGADVQLLGQLTHSDGILSFKLPLPPRLLLRPHKVMTSAFGQMWPVHGAERKAVIAAASTPAAFQQLVTSELGFAPVDTIGLECISCAELLGSGERVLTHAKLGLMNGRGLELTVRARELRLADSVFRAVQALLS